LLMVICGNCRLLLNSPRDPSGPPQGAQASKK
jgi:hypothetical protein